MIRGALAPILMTTSFIGGLAAEAGSSTTSLIFIAFSVLLSLLIIGE